MKEVKLNINDEQAKAIKDGKLKVALIPADALEKVDGGWIYLTHLSDKEKVPYKKEEMVAGIEMTGFEVLDVLKDATAGIFPDDFESIDILKDNSATAIYGSRGAHGVILTT